MAQPSLNMDGPFPFTEKEIARAVRLHSPGNFALGYVARGSFHVALVDWSRDDVADELYRRLGTHDKFQAFKFSYAASVTAAWTKICKTWHEFGKRAQLISDKHPEPPPGFVCPICRLSAKVETGRAAKADAQTLIARRRRAAFG